jgi:hypothetical protein
VAEIPIQRKEHDKKRSILPMILAALALLALLGWCMTRGRDEPAPVTDSAVVDTAVAPAPVTTDTTVRIDTTSGAGTTTPADTTKRP